MSPEIQKFIKRRETIVRLMRTIILLTGAYQTLFGEFMVGFAILASLVAITVPSLITRGRIKSLPLDFEYILFIMVMLQFVIGETLNFYENVNYYDKLVHFTLPMLLGYITSVLVYTMYITGNLRMTLAPAMVVIVLVTLGIGAFWEIIEYAADQLLGTYLQGSLTSPPLIDTMNDLIVDTLGGIFGAVLALRFARSHDPDKRGRLTALTTELNDDYAKLVKH
jgi:hypothetical protein